VAWTGEGSQSELQNRAVIDTRIQGSTELVRHGEIKISLVPSLLRSTRDVTERHHSVKHASLTATIRMASTARCLAA
jgi:hypothetical protein